MDLHNHHQMLYYQLVCCLSVCCCSCLFICLWRADKQTGWRATTSVSSGGAPASRNPIISWLPSCYATNYSIHQQLKNNKPLNYVVAHDIRQHTFLVLISYASIIRSNVILDAIFLPPLVALCAHSQLGIEIPKRRSLIRKPTSGKFGKMDWALGRWKLDEPAVSLFSVWGPSKWLA